MNTAEIDFLYTRYQNWLAREYITHSRSRAARRKRTHTMTVALKAMRTFEKQSAAMGRPFFNPKRVLDMLA